jgi:TetR/AcrR family transcriptional repressor of acrEF/envCD operon
MTSLRQKQKQQTREKLLKVAFEEFSTTGLLATKTLDIAKSAHISHGAIFSHFPSKEALLLAVINEFGMQLGMQFQRQMKQGTIEAVLTVHLNVLEQWEPFYRQLVICGPHLPENIRTAIFNIQSGIAYYLEKALQNQLFASQAPIHLILNSWLGIVHYYLANRDLFCPNGSVLAAKGKELIDFFIKFLKGQLL